MVAVGLHTAEGSQWDREGMKQSESSTFRNRQFLLTFQIIGQVTRLHG